MRHLSIGFMFALVAAIPMTGCGLIPNDPPYEIPDGSISRRGDMLIAPAVDAGAKLDMASPCSGKTPDNCGGICVNTDTDPANCGACGTACGQGFVCGDGRCSTVCPQGQTACGLSCYDLLSDVEHCGNCNEVCWRNPNTDVTCLRGTCLRQCSVGFGNCNGDPSDGCETTLTTDPANCGACGNACAQGGQCINGACVACVKDADCGGGGKACFNGTCYTLAGSFVVTDKNAPLWNDPNTVAMSCVEVCAQKFGAGVYACSTLMGIVNGQSWTQCNGGNNSNHCTKPVDQAYKKGVKYNCGGNDCACSSYVDLENGDGCPISTNNCYKQ